MRIVFMGTPEESVAPLRALVEAGHEIALVVTQPDRKRGRGAKLIPSPVKKAATELALPVSHKMKDVLEIDADLGIVVAFGRLIKSPVLEHLTWLNLHPSLLPRWRGATPVESAILAGDDVTGVCVMRLDEGMDTGDIYARSETPILPGETADQLSDRLFAEGTRLLLEQLDSGLAQPKPQEGKPTYAQKLSPADFRLDWSRSSVELERIIRLGRAWTTFRGKRMRILSAAISEERLNLPPGSVSGTKVATLDASIELLQVQPESKGPQDAQAWTNGARPKKDDLFV